MYRVTCLYQSTRISGKYFPEEDYLFIYLLTDGREHFNVKNKEKNIRNVLDDLFKLVYSNISEKCFK